MDTIGTILLGILSIYSLVVTFKLIESNLQKDMLEEILNKYNTTCNEIDED